MDDSIVSSNHAALMRALGLGDGEDEGELEHDYSSDENASDSSSSPVLIEVDDSSPIDDMVENGGRPFFDDIMTSPTINTSSQESSLAPSSPGLNVTMFNVGTGSPQATFVIGDNTNNHSSRYQAIPIESVEDKIRRITPVQFLPLQQLFCTTGQRQDFYRNYPVIEQRSEGWVDETLRSSVGPALGPGVYATAGASSLKEYLVLAVRAGIMKCG
ncbi:hypothetical protein M405DRAFT_845678 [Rhizopogon salebrosus TDB-379]|nr:hypothetical protein M405DRAFT_845678 [Rhizopogon salebrosus TDB-379]